MNYFALIFSLILISIPTVIFSTKVPFYSAVSSKAIRPCSTYNITIFVESVENAVFPEPLRFSATLHSSRTDRTSVSPGQENSVSPGSSAILSIPVENLQERVYNLTVKARDSSGNLIDEQKFTILTIPPNPGPVILIQTDKPIYQPGETFRFRVVLLDSELFKPLDDQLLDLKVYDDDANVIKVWQNVTVSSGLFRAELELSNEAVLGHWDIEVEVKSKEGSTTEEDIWRRTAQRQSLTFKVDKYVRPKFEVTVKPPFFLTFDGTDIPVQVRAKYANGKGVTGQCTLISKIATNSYTPFDPNPVSTSVDIEDAYTIIKVNLKSLFGKNDLIEKDIEFKATVTEMATGIRANGTAWARLYRYPYKIEPMDEPGSLKPGLPLKIAFKVSTQDDKPISDPSPNAFKVIHGFSYSNSTESFKTSIPHDGIVKLTFDTPTNDRIDILNMELQYKELTTTHHLPKNRRSEANVYMQLTLSQEMMKTGDDFAVTVNITRPIRSLNYVISNATRILSSGRQSYAQPKKEVTLELTCPSAATRAAFLVVYTILSDGHAVGDRAVLEVADNGRGNFLNISASRKIGQPGENVTLTLTTTKGSIVALRGVNRSVLFLREDTDITQKRLEDESGDKNGDLAQPWSRSSFLFANSGLVVLGNAKIPTEEEFYYGYDDYATERVEDGMMLPPTIMMAPVLGPMAPSSTGLAIDPNDIPSIGIAMRPSFPEVWLWEELKVNESSVEITRTFPDTLTSWIITGFSFNSENGIGILKSPTKLTTSRPFVIR